MRSAAAKLRSSEHHPRNGEKSGLTSPWKKLMARLRQRLRRGKTRRASSSFSRSSSYFTTIVSTRRGVKQAGRDARCRQLWCIIISADVRIHTVATKLTRFLSELGVDPARLLVSRHANHATISRFETFAEMIHRDSRLLEFAYALLRARNGNASHFPERSLLSDTRHLTSRNRKNRVDNLFVECDSLPTHGADKNYGLLVYRVKSLRRDDPRK